MCAINLSADDFYAVYKKDGSWSVVDTLPDLIQQ